MECITNNNKEEDVEGRQEYDEERTWSTCCDYGGLCVWIPESPVSTLGLEGASAIDPQPSTFTKEHALLMFPHWWGSTEEVFQTREILWGILLLHIGPGGFSLWGLPSGCCEPPPVTRVGAPARLVVVGVAISPPPGLPLPDKLEGAAQPVMKVILLGLSLVRTSLQYSCAETGLQYKRTAVQLI